MPVAPLAYANDLTPCRMALHFDYASAVSGQRRPQPPSAHRTVRTGPYTAPHARRIHWETSTQCASFRSDRISCPFRLINQLLGYALVTALAFESTHRLLFEKTVFDACFRGTPPLDQLSVKMLFSLLLTH